MENLKIPKILSKLHYTIKESYYGGITEVYKPYGKNIHSFDVNSLYPHSMKKYPMPVGKPEYF
jgi:DNA polymerase elongation subunit (family B)